MTNSVAEPLGVLHLSGVIPSVTSFKITPVISRMENNRIMTVTNIFHKVNSRVAYQIQISSKGIERLVLDSRPIKNSVATIFRAGTGHHRLEVYQKIYSKEASSINITLLQL